MRPPKAGAVNINDLKIRIEEGGFDTVFSEFYGPGREKPQAERYSRLIAGLYPGEPVPKDCQVRLFSSPGRTELGGNHTDHNRGRVLAAAVHLDIAAAAVREKGMAAVIFSEGREISVNLESLEPLEKEKGCSEALVRGTAAGLKKKGYKIGGFRAAINSSVPVGAGLSSSAAFSVLIGTILNTLYNSGAASPLVLAQAARDAENRFFSKPCGLMDQTAVAFGGTLAIDFKDPENPLISRISFAPEDYGFTLCIVQTGGSHENLTPDYASIPQEMFAVARFLGAESCRDLAVENLLKKGPEVRRALGDRALLRAFHFTEETNRAGEMAAALCSGDMDLYLRLIRESGRSSALLLQNSYPPAYPEQQGISLALYLSSRFCGNGGAARVHGGGFAGTVACYVPTNRLSGYRNIMEPYFGPDSVIPVRIRPQGAAPLL